MEIHRTSMLSHLAQGTGLWDGTTDRKATGFEDNSKLFAGLDLSGPHRHGITIQSSRCRKSPAIRVEEVDGLLNIPKTYLTRKGALLLYSSDRPYSQDHDQHGSNKKSANMEEVLARLGNVRRLMASVLFLNDGEDVESNMSISDDNNQIYLGFLHSLDSVLHKQKIKPGCDLSFYLQTLRLQACKLADSAGAEISQQIHLLLNTPSSRPTTTGSVGSSAKRSVLNSANLAASVKSASYLGRKMDFNQPLVQLPRPYTSPSKDSQPLNVEDRPFTIDSRFHTCDHDSPQDGDRLLLVDNLYDGDTSPHEDVEDEDRPSSAKSASTYADDVSIVKEVDLNISAETGSLEGDEQAVFNVDQLPDIDQPTAVREADSANERHLTNTPEAGHRHLGDGELISLSPEITLQRSISTSFSISNSQVTEKPNPNTTPSVTRARSATPNDATSSPDCARTDKHNESQRSIRPRSVLKSSRKNSAKSSVSFSESVEASDGINTESNTLMNTPEPLAVDITILKKEGWQTGEQLKNAAGEKVELPHIAGIESVMAAQQNKKTVPYRRESASDNATPVLLSSQSSISHASNDALMFNTDDIELSPSVSNLGSRLSETKQAPGASLHNEKTRLSKPAVQADQNNAVLSLPEHSVVDTPTAANAAESALPTPNPSSNARPKSSIDARAGLTSQRKPPPPKSDKITIAKLASLPVRHEPTIPHLGVSQLETPAIPRKLEPDTFYRRLPSPKAKPQRKSAKSRKNTTFTQPTFDLEAELILEKQFETPSQVAQMLDSNVMDGLDLDDSDEGGPSAEELELAKLLYQEKMQEAEKDLEMSFQEQLAQTKPNKPAEDSDNSKNGKKKNSLTNEADPESSHRKELEEKRKMLREAKKAEKRKLLGEKQALQEQIALKNKLLHEAKKAENAQLMNLLDEEDYQRRMAEEARQQEEDARASLAASRLLAKEERERRRQEELERRKEEAIRRRESQKDMMKAGRVKELEMLEKISDAESLRRLREEERRKREEQEELLAERIAEEEALAQLKAEEEEARMTQIEREVEEAALARLVEERMQAEKMERELSNRRRELMEEEAKRREQLEKEEQMASEELRKKEAEEQQQLEEEKRRIEELKKMQLEAQEKLKQEIENKRRELLRLRAVNLEKKHHLASMKRNQAFTKPWVFSYHKNWPRETYERLMGTSDKRRQVKKKT